MTLFGSTKDNYTVTFGFEGVTYMPDRHIHHTVLRKTNHKVYVTTKINHIHYKKLHHKSEKSFLSCKTITYIKANPIQTNRKDQNITENPLK